MPQMVRPAHRSSSKVTKVYLLPPSDEGQWTDILQWPSQQKTTRKVTYWPTKKLLKRLPVWPDWPIYWTLGNFLKPLTTINLSKSTTFLSNFCKDVKIYHFSSEIIFRQFLLAFGDFFLVTPKVTYVASILPNWKIFSLLLVLEDVLGSSWLSAGSFVLRVTESDN